MSNVTNLTDHKFPAWTVADGANEFIDALKHAEEEAERGRDPMPNDKNLPKLKTKPANAPPNIVIHDDDAITNAPNAPDLIPADYREPWNRTEDETDQSWKYFVYYRNAGPTRSINKTAAHFKVKYGSIGRMSAQHRWPARAAAFDEYEDRVYQIRRQIAIREMAERHADQMVDALEALTIPFKALAQKFANEPGLIDEMAERDVKSLLGMAAQAGRIAPQLMSAERLARGMPSDIVQVDTEVTHVHEITTDSLATVLEELERAGAFDARISAGSVEEIIDAEVIEVHSEGETETD